MADRRLPRLIFGHLRDYKRKGIGFILFSGHPRGSNPSCRAVRKADIWNHEQSDDVFEIRIQIIIDYSQENYSIDPGIFSYGRFSLNFVSKGGEASISEEPERFIVFFRVDLLPLDM